LVVIARPSFMLWWFSCAFFQPLKLAHMAGLATARSIAGTGEAHVSTSGLTVAGQRINKNT